MMDASEPPRRHRDADDLAYDYFKHMTSLSLVALGGVLTISQIPDAEPKPFSLGTAVVLLAAGGISGFAGMDEIVKARFDGKDASKRIALYRKLCPATFGMGIGAFLTMFFNALY
jgi:hypothetical protein